MMCSKALFPKALVCTRHGDLFSNIFLNCGTVYLIQNLPFDHLTSGLSTLMLLCCHCNSLVTDLLPSSCVENDAPFKQPSLRPQLLVTSVLRLHELHLSRCLVHVESHSARPFASVTVSVVNLTV